MAAYLVGMPSTVDIVSTNNPSVRRSEAMIQVFWAAWHPVLPKLPSTLSIIHRKELSRSTIPMRTIFSYSKVDQNVTSITLTVIPNDHTSHGRSCDCSALSPNLSGEWSSGAFHRTEPWGAVEADMCPII